MSGEKLDRRTFFKRAATIGAAVTGAGALLSACKSESGGSESGSAKQAEKSGGSGSAAKQAKGGGDLNCMDAPDLTDAQKNTRKSLKYADSSDKEGQLCDNCQYWEPPKNEGECGGCQVVPGPIHPKGWCSSWTEMKG